LAQVSVGSEQSIGASYDDGAVVFKVAAGCQFGFRARIPVFVLDPGGNSFSIFRLTARNRTG
jgi:hypothetical protein